MPTNKLLEDKLNNWAKNWRRQQEEMKKNSTQNFNNQLIYFGERPKTISKTISNFIPDYYDPSKAVNNYPYQNDDIITDNINMSLKDYVKIPKELLHVKNLHNNYASYRYNDKYKHAMINCQMAQRGNAGAFVADVMSKNKEKYDIATRGNTLSESYADMQANLQGRKLGYNNPNGDCDQMVQQYYPKYYPKK